MFKNFIILLTALSAGDQEGLPVAGRPEEERASLVGDPVARVVRARREEAAEVVSDARREISAEHDAIIAQLRWLL